ncbi:MAG: DsrE family protein [Nitrospirota bacterium]|jgi:sulfur relay (sulfurtransferase) DsrF/TusC family protein
MAQTKLAFVVQRLPYKSENSKLAITHAISYQVVEILLDEGDTVVPALCFTGEGVLGCLKDQKAMENYGMTSTETHVKNALLVDADVFVCKEDLERFGITEDRLVDAEDMGADKRLQIVPFESIQKEIESANHVLFF